MVNVKVSKYKTFEEVPVWQKAHALVLLVYKITEKFPKTEVYGLVTQLRKSSSSVPANIAEGFCRNTTKELLRFLYNARGSCGETVYHLQLARDLGYLSSEDYQLLKKGYDEIGRQLNGWIKSLQSKL